MTTMEIGRRRPAAKVGRPFYLMLSILMALVFIAGFSTSVPGDFQKPGIPWLLHLHGMVFTCWVLVFVAQPAFITRGSVALHRKIGWVGAGLAVAMVVMAITATLVAIHMDTVPPFFPKGVFLVMNTLGIVVFGGIVTAGIALRRNAEWHKRLMLIATISILGPGLGRLLGLANLGAVTPLIMNAIILAFALSGVVADLIVRRRVHPAYPIGIAVILVTDVLIGVLGMSPLALAAVKAIHGA